MSINKRNDLLDSLLFAAAKDAGADDIGEYKSESAGGVLPDSLAEKICGIAEKQDVRPKTGKLGFRRFIAVAVAAAVLVCVLTVAGIAGRKQRTASVAVSESQYGFVLAYDISGVRPNENVTLPDVPNGYALVDNVGADSVRFEKDGIVYTCLASKLCKDYRKIIGTKSDTEYFGFIVADKYNGCVAVTTKDNGSVSCAVYWNDGNTAYELYADTSSDNICRAARDICG